MLMRKGGTKVDSLSCVQCLSCGNYWVNSTDPILPCLSGDTVNKIASIIIFTVDLSKLIFQNKKKNLILKSA